MRIQAHIDKISWSFGDKSLFIIYGIFQLVQINAMEPDQYGLFLLLLSLNSWIFLVSDALALQGVIQFGYTKENIPKVNLIALIIHVTLTMAAGMTVYFSGSSISKFFDEPALNNISGILPVLCIMTIPRTYAIKLLYRDQQLKHIFYIDFAFFFSMIIITIIMLAEEFRLTYTDMANIYLYGSAFSSIVGIFIVRKKLLFGTGGEMSLKHFLKFSIPLTLAASVLSIPKMLEVFFIRKFFPLEVVGVYGSAKTLFRLFDVSTDAAYGLIYPSAVKQITNKNREELVALITKSVSFMFIVYLAAVIILELGLGSFIINTFLPAKYSMALSYFNLMLIAALALPFIVIGLVINAESRPHYVLSYASISLAAFIVTFWFVGNSGNDKLIPLGLIAFNVIFGAFCYLYLKIRYKLPLKSLFRAFGDVKNYLESRKNNK